MRGHWTYVIRWNLRTEGVVEERDVIGTLYNATDSLGEDLSIRALKRRGEIDRISLFDLEPENGRTEGTIEIRCDFGLWGTARLAAALETIGKIGPCKAELEAESIRPTRKGGRKLAGSWIREDAEGVEG